MNRCSLADSISESATLIDIVDKRLCRLPRLRGDSMMRYRGVSRFTRSRTPLLNSLIASPILPLMHGSHMIGRVVSCSRSGCTLSGRARTFGHKTSSFIPRRTGAAALRRANPGADHGSSKPGRRSALWSNVRVRAQPALVPSAPIRASANEPSPLLSATMAVKTSCSFSTMRTSV